MSETIQTSNENIVASTIQMKTTKEASTQSVLSMESSEVIISENTQVADERNNGEVTDSSSTISLNFDKVTTKQKDTTFGLHLITNPGFSAEGNFN